MRSSFLIIKKNNKNVLRNNLYISYHRSFQGYYTKILLKNYKLILLKKENYTNIHT